MRALLLVAVMVLPCSAAAQMYKCVDERGVTHYSDKPRPGCKGAQVDIRASPPISGKVQGRHEDLAREDADFKRRQNERERAAAKEQARLSSGQRLVQLNAALRGCP